MPEQRRPSGGHADQERAEPSAIARSASAWEKVKTAAIIGASAGGAILAVAAGAPTWFGAVYAALGLFAAAYRIRRYRGRPVPRRRPSAGPRPELAAHLALAAPPGSDRPSPRRRGTPDESSAPRRAAPGSGEPSPARHAVPAPPPPSPARRAAPASGQPSPARRAAPAPRPLSTAARADAAAATVLPWPAGPAVAGPAPAASAAHAAAVAPSAAPATAAAAAPSAVPAAPSPPAAPSAAGTRRFAPKAERWVGTPALGYVLVSRADGEDAEDPGEAIRGLCNAHRLHLRRVVRDVEAAPGDPQTRPALEWALDQLDAGEAQTLVVARLGHLTDSAAGLPELLRWFGAHHRRLVAIDVQLDTATEAGWVTAGALAQVGGWERQRISTRTRRGLAAARARGRPSVADVPELRDRIVGLRESGMTLQAIADQLNTEGVPTLRGGSQWRPSSVQAATGYQRPASGTKRLAPDPPGESGSEER